MRTRAAAAALGLLVTAAGAVLAAPFTTAFTDLSAELVLRRDNDYPEPLDKTGKKELKAIVKCLAALDKPADDLADDLKTATKVAKTLEKAFATEFPSDALVLYAGDPFPFVLDAALDALETEVLSGISTLEGRLVDLGPKAAFAVSKAVVNAGEALGAETVSRADRAKALQKAWAQVLKGDKAADKDDGSGGGGGGGGGGGPNVTLTIGGVTHSVDAASAVYVSAIGALSITLSDAGPPLAGAGVTATIAGSGEYTIATGVALRGTDNWQAFSSGTLSITTFDLPMQRIGGSFSFTAAGVGGTVGTVDVVCTFDITGMMIF